MKRILLLVCLFILSGITDTGVRAEEKITSFHSTIQVNTNGTIDVEETIIYDFGTTPRHGIFRDIPYIISNSDGKKFVIEMNNFSVVDGAGNTLPVEKTTNSGTVYLRIGDPDRTITGVHTYVIKYKASGALRYFSDHDELYWNVNGPGWGVRISNVQATVVLPKSVDGAQLKLACYTGPQGSTAADCALTTEDRTIYFAAKSPFNPYQGMTIVTGFPKGIVEVLEPKPVFEQSQLGMALIAAALVGFVIFVILWYIVYPFRIIYKWFKHGRDPKGTVGIIRAGFEPPNGPTGEPLTPAETGALLDETVHQRDVSALLVDMARRAICALRSVKRKIFTLLRLNQRRRRHYFRLRKTF
jgi:hypothetical protein